MKRKKVCLNTFERALAAVLKNAPNTFSKLKGEFDGTKNANRKYKTSLVLRDKAFLPLYILENGREWKFVFVNKNISNYESSISSIVTLLNKKGIKYQQESSASVEFTKYTWDNETFEIIVLTKRYTDKFFEVGFYHRD